MMAALEAILGALDARKNQVLLVAQAALPASQFEAFRKIFLDQFGRNGFQRELETLLREQPDRDGTGRPTRAMKGGGP
jgi:hypothetical protein